MRSTLYSWISAFALLLLHGTASGQNAAQNMTLLGNWNPGGLLWYSDVWGYADCSGREYAIIGSAFSIHFIDVTQPNFPRLVKSFGTTGSSVWRDFKTYRDRAYACADQSPGTDGLMIFDLSRLPDTVARTYQSTQYFERSHNLWIDTLQGRLYMAGANTRNNGVIVFDLTQNPDDPQLLASVPLPGGYVHDIHVVDHIGYASHGFNGLWIYDFTDPQNPVVLGNITDYPERGYNHSSWLNADGSYLVMVDETHGTSAKLVDVRDTEDLSVVSIFKSALLEPEHTSSIIHNPFIRDQYVVMAYYHDGIQVFDMSDPGNVERVAYYDTNPLNANYSGFQGAWGAYPYLPSGNILGSDIAFGLFILRADSIQFQPGPRHRFPVAAIETENTVFCEGADLELHAAAGAESYSWYLDDIALAGEGSTLNVNAGGYYRVEARNGHCAARSGPVWIEEAQPLQPQVDAVGNALSCRDSLQFVTFQWYFNGSAIPGANGASWEAGESGVYTLETTDLNGCTATSQSVQVTLSAVPEPHQGRFRVFPNPVGRHGSITLTDLYTLAPSGIFVLRDALGREQRRLALPGAAGQEIPIDGLAPGLYFYEISTPEGQRLGAGKLVVAR